MSKRSIFLFGLFIVIVALFLGYLYWSNGSSPAVGTLSTPTLESLSNEFSSDDPTCGYKITLHPQLVSPDQVSVDVTVANLQVDIPDLKIAVNTSPALQRVDVPQTTFVLHKNQPIHTTFRLIGTPAGKSELVGVNIIGTTRIGRCGYGAGFWLDSQGGKWQILSDAEYYRRHPATPGVAVPMIGIELKPQLIGADQILIAVTITPADELTDLTLKVTTTPGLKVIETPSSSFVAHRNQPIHTFVRVSGLPNGSVEQITIEAFGTQANLGRVSSGNGARIFLESQNGTWLVESPEQYYQRHPPTNSASSSAAVSRQLVNKI